MRVVGIVVDLRCPQKFLLPQIGSRHLRISIEISLLGMRVAGVVLGRLVGGVVGAQSLAERLEYFLTRLH